MITEKNVTTLDVATAFASCRILVERINVLALLNGDEKYVELITRWNTRIDAYRNTISRRLDTGKGGSTETGDWFTE